MSSDRTDQKGKKRGRERDRERKSLQHSREGDHGDSMSVIVVWQMLLHCRGEGRGERGLRRPHTAN